jgi:hypothetical protein
MLGVARDLRCPRSLTHPAKEAGGAVAPDLSVVVGMHAPAERGLGR